MLMELGASQRGIRHGIVSGDRTHPVQKLEFKQPHPRISKHLGTYNGNLATELVLDLALLDRIRSFILDDAEQLFDAHLVV